MSVPAVESLFSPAIQWLLGVQGKFWRLPFGLVQNKTQIFFVSAGIHFLSVFLGQSNVLLLTLPGGKHRLDSCALGLFLVVTRQSRNTWENSTSNHAAGAKWRVAGSTSFILSGISLIPAFPMSEPCEPSVLQALSLGATASSLAEIFVGGRPCRKHTVILAKALGVFLWVRTKAQVESRVT